MPSVGTSSGDGSVQESELIHRIQEEIKAAAELGLMSGGIEDLDPLWRTEVEQEPWRFINRDLSPNVDALRNFWLWGIFLGDIPSGPVAAS